MSQHEQHPQPQSADVKQPTGRGPGGTDDPGQAPEAGEPQVSGRSHGHVVDRQNPGGPKGSADQSTPKSGNEHFESGRHDAGTA